MKNKYFILVLTFLCLFMGQKSYAQDWQDFHDDFAWDYSNDDFDFGSSFDDDWNNDFGADVNGGTLNNVTVPNNYHAPIYSGLLDPYNYTNQEPSHNFDEPQEDPPVKEPTIPTATVDPEVCTLAVCAKAGYVVDSAKCECVPTPKNWYLDNDEDGYYSETVYEVDKPSDKYKETTKGFDCDDNDASKNTGSSCGYKYWYLDRDGDGYHSDETESFESPGTGWILTTKGIDCYESDPERNIYCGNKMWYTDSDNDGWYGNIKASENTPGPGWIENTVKPAKGQDCDDTKPSTNNVCAPINNCDEIKKQQANPKYQAVMKELTSQEALKRHYETGYWQDSNGDYHKMDVNGSRSVVLPKDRTTLENFEHLHMNDWNNPETGTPVSSYPMPSNTDIFQVYNLYKNTRENGLDLGNTYVGTSSNLGSFQMRFIGDSDKITSSSVDQYLEFLTSEENIDAYSLSMELYGDVAGLLAFIRDMGISGDIALYQIEKSGVSKLELNSNNQVNKIPCN